MQINNPLEKFGLKDVISVFSSRQDGNMSLCYGNVNESLESRRKFLSAVGIDYHNLIFAKQVHGNNVAYVTENNKGSGALDFNSSVSDRDGFLTDKKNVPIAILTADCLSVFIYDPAIPAVGILHAGWRSTEKNICGQGVRQMQGRFGSRPEELLIGFGPSIRSCCCKMENGFKSNFPFGLINRGADIYMDIALINSKQLEDCGVKKDNIFDPKRCTFSKNQDFFSFRKEADASGRMISVIMLK